MAKISEHINYSNNNIRSYDQMIKMIVNLGINICKNSNNFTCQLSRLQNFSLMSIFNTPENDLSNVDCKSYMRKVRKYSVNSSSTLYYC